MKDSGNSSDSQPSSPANELATRSLDVLVVPTDDRSELLAEMLAAGKSTRLPVWGPSMLPSIRTGDVVEVGPVQAAKLRVGDVVVCRLPCPALVVHRLVAKSRWQGEWWLVLWPETVLSLNAPLSERYLLGKVVAVERAGRPVDFSRRIPLILRYRARSRLLQMSHPRLGRWLRTLLWPAWRAFSALLRGLPKLATGPVVGRLLRRYACRIVRELRVQQVPAGPPPHDRDWRWLALYRDQMIGTIGLSSTFGDQIGFPSYWLVGLWIDPWYRRRKIAHRLLRQAIGLAADHGIDELWAAVRRDNAASVRLFSSCGFLPTHDPNVQERIDHWEKHTASWPPGTAIVLHLDVPVESADEK